MRNGDHILVRRKLQMLKFFRLNHLLILVEYYGRGLEGYDCTSQELLKRVEGLTLNKVALVLLHDFMYAELPFLLVRYVILTFFKRATSLPYLIVRSVSV